MNNEVCCQCKTWAPLPCGQRGLCVGRLKHWNSTCDIEAFDPLEECCGRPMTVTSDAAGRQMIYCPACKRTGGPE
jgi:hypothetical protein